MKTPTVSQVVDLTLAMHDYDVEDSITYVKSLLARLNASPDYVSKDATIERGLVVIDALVKLR